MSGDVHTPTPAAPAPGPDPVSEAAARAASSPPGADERPEVLAGAAFAGGLMLALILKRLGR